MANRFMESVGEGIEALEKELIQLHRKQKQARREEDIEESARLERLEHETIIEIKRLEQYRRDHV